MYKLSELESLGNGYFANPAGKFSFSLATPSPNFKPEIFLQKLDPKILCGSDECRMKITNGIQNTAIKTFTIFDDAVEVVIDERLKPNQIFFHDGEKVIKMWEVELDNK